MIRLLFYSTSFFLIISLFISISQAEEVTLEDAVSLALKSSESIRIIENQANEIRMNAKETTAFIKPQISLLANYTKMDNNIPGAASSFPIFFPDKEVGAELQGSQLLYAGRRIWRSLDLKKNLNHQASLQENVGKRDIRRSVANAFHGALFQRNTMEIFINRRNQRLAELEDANDLFEVGMVAQLDVRQAKLNVNFAEDALMNSEAKYDEAVINLNIAMGRSGRNDLMLPKGLLSEVPDLHSLLRSLEEKLKQDTFLDLQLLNNEYETAKLDHQLARGEYHPELMLVSSAATRGEEYDDRYEYYNIGLQLKWDLFTGGAVRAKTGAARMRMQSAEESIEKRQKELAGDVERISINLDTLLERETTQKESVILSKENYEDARAQYRAGTITLTRLGDFSLDDAESKFALARIYFLQQELGNDMIALIDQK
jgi:outer membrane protein TolC